MRSPIFYKLFSFYWAPSPLYLLQKLSNNTYRGYYTVARRYEFYFRVAKQYFTHSLRSFVKYCFRHEKIKFISSSRRVVTDFYFPKQNFLKYKHVDIFYECLISSCVHLPDLPILYGIFDAFNPLAILWRILHKRMALGKALMLTYFLVKQLRIRYSATQT